MHATEWNLMKLKLRKTRAQRHKVPITDWDTSIELLAMQLCPAAEWRKYERHLQALARQSNTQNHPKQTKVKVFPVWRKYRQQAKRVATLYQALPMFKRLPLGLSGFIGNLLFQ